VSNRSCQRSVRTRDRRRWPAGPSSGAGPHSPGRRRRPLPALACTLFAAFVATFCTMTSAALAQTATGQITGTARDASGAVMSGVKVVITNQQTGLTRETKTGGNGEYVIPLLPVGVYVVTGEQTGFKTAIRSDVTLTVDQIQRVDLALAPGNVSETVEVQANALALDTGSASVGQTITEKQVTELPLNGRNSCSSCSLALALWKPRASRAACVKASATPSASWARDPLRTTS